MKDTISVIGKALCVLVSLACIAFLVVMNIRDRSLLQQTAEEVAAVNEDTRETEKEIAQAEAEEKAAALREKEANDSFYQKLADGFSVNILVVGDTIANGYGASHQDNTWTSLLEKSIEDNYNVEVSLDNKSILESGAYVSYASVKMIEDKEYDLAIVCTGVTDSEESLPVYYEATLRAIKSQFQKCSVICVQEYMESENNAKNLCIMTLANAYNAYCADLHNQIAAEPSTYMQDGGYLNDAGNALYAESVFSLIKQGVDSKAEYNVVQEAPLSAEAAKYDQFLYVPAERFTRKGNQYSLETSFTGIVSFDCAVVPGDNLFEVYVDRVKTNSYTVTNNISVPLEHIELIDGEVKANRRIGVIFRTDGLADNFRGMCVTTTG